MQPAAGLFGMTLFETIQSIAALLALIGVVIAVRQLQLSARDSKSRFEDALTEQYRSIIAHVPLAALLGQRLEEAELQKCLRAFYDYFDLCNEQAFLAERKRVRGDTWQEWREGIAQHLNRPAFQEAWTRLAEHLDGSFDEFRRLLPNELLVARVPSPQQIGSP